VPAHREKIGRGCIVAFLSTASCFICYLFSPQEVIYENRDAGAERALLKMSCKSGACAEGVFLKMRSAAHNQGKRLTVNSLIG
jgi:hypothetical protein